MSDPFPTPGVSEVASSGRAGAHVATKEQARTDGAPGQRPANLPPSGRKVRRGDDPLRPELLKGGRRVDTGGSTPAGVRGNNSASVIEAPLNNRQRSRRTTIAYRSVDGREYVFRIPPNEADRKRELPQVMVTLALREIGLGGDPFAVYDAFGFHLKDLNGQQVYPIERTIGDMLTEGTSPAPAEPSVDMGFQLGDDDQDAAEVGG